MTNRKSKKSIDLLVFVFIVAIMLTSYSSYSKYTSSVNASASVNVAAWNVKINDEDITNSISLSEELNFNPLNEDTTKVASGKLAPNSKGYFDISIDTSSAEVAARYSITIDTNSVESLNGITILGYEEVEIDSAPGLDSLQNVEYDSLNNNPKITGEILLENDKGKVVNLRVYLEWQDEGTDAANNAQTSVATSDNRSISIPVNILVEQLN